MQPRAVRLHTPGQPLRLEPQQPLWPGPGQVLLRVRTCGVCRTDLHVFDGELDAPKLPLVLGHEIIGEVAQLGSGVHGLQLGQRVGVPWLGHTCQSCRYCARGQENLCERALFTGYTLDGGYADFALADSRYCFAIPDRFDDLHAAPLLCAGLIGYRALVLAGPAEHVGLYGFGAAAHILLQVLRAQGRKAYAFVRPGDSKAANFALELGAVFAADSDRAPPRELDAAILFAPVGALVPAALKAVAPGGNVIAAGIHMSDIPSFPYSLLWRERSVKSVANLTRRDGEEFLPLAARCEVNTHVTEFPLEDANAALEQLRGGQLSGAAVLRVSEP